MKYSKTLGGTIGFPFESTLSTNESSISSWVTVRILVNPFVSSRNISLTVGG
jgi:hypothetical protein